MDHTEIQELVLISTIVLLILVIALIVFFFYFQQKKTAYLIEQRETQKRFEEEINNSKLEIQEQTLQNISWEIHDNVGQLLSVAKMQLNILQMSLPEALKEDIRETGEIVGKSLEELRGLAKSLNTDKIKKIGLIASVKSEVDRYNRLNFIKASVEVSDNQYIISNEEEIILFRILQEFCNNTLKYAKAKHLKINLNYKKNQLEIVAEDDGKGFDIADLNIQNGIGLQNMRSRASLIGAKLDLKSALNIGTKLYISCLKK